jgi:hypothetical protein
MMKLAILLAGVSGKPINDLGINHKKVLIEDSATWMADPIIQSKTLTEVKMPGIHHSAAYSFMNGDMGSTATSSLDLYDALMAGVRYFDSRPAHHKG